MKRFLIHVTLCFIILVVICMIPCLIFEKKAKECTKTAPYSKINLVSNLNRADADVIIVGNSRAEYSYNDSILSALTGKKCLNIGLSGYSFEFQYHVMYKRYLAHNNIPKFVILEVGPVAFFKHASNPYSIEMLPYVNQNDFDAYIDMCPELTIADKVMFVRYFGKLDLVAKQIHKFNRQAKKKGVRKPNWNRENDTIRMVVEYDTTIIHLFQRFLDECNEQDTKVIMVCSPMHGKYGKSRYNIDMFWQIIKYYSAGKKIPILDYEDLYDSETAFFADPMHLNHYGRDCFSAKLAHDLDSLGLLK